MALSKNRRAWVVNKVHQHLQLVWLMTFIFLYSYDVGMINASAEGVHIKTELDLSQDSKGRLKISNMTCDATINRMQAGFSGTLKWVFVWCNSILDGALENAKLNLPKVWTIQVHSVSIFHSIVKLYLCVGASCNQDQSLMLSLAVQGGWYCIRPPPVVFCRHPIVGGACGFSSAALLSAQAMCSSLMM